MWTHKRIRSFRDYLGDTQPEFAKRLGVSHDLVIAWEQPPKRGRKPNPRSRTPAAPLKMLLDRIAADEGFDQSRKISAQSQ